MDYASVERIVTDQLVRDAITNDLLTKAALPVGVFLRGCDGFVKPKSVEALRVAASLPECTPEQVIETCKQIYSQNNMTFPI